MSMIEFGCVLIYMLVVVLTIPLDDNSYFNKKEVWMSILWPLVLSWWLFKSSLAAANELFSWLMWIFGIKYRSTTIYRWIDNKLNVSGL